MEENKLHRDELDNSFEKDLESAFILNERKAFKSLFKNIDTQNDLEEKEIERAFVLNERRRLKSQFNEIDENDKKKVVTHKSNWRKLSIAASIIGLIVTTSIWILNHNNSTQDQGITKIETKKIEEEKHLDSIKRKSIEQEYFAVLNSREKYAKSKTLDVRKLKQFGFGSNNDRKVKIINYNLDKQIEVLEKFENIVLLDSNYSFGKMMNFKKDSLIDLKNKYTFDLTTLITYNINSSDVEVYFFKDKYYLKVSSYYFEVSKSNTPMFLKRFNDIEIIEQLDAL